MEKAIAITSRCYSVSNLRYSAILMFFLAWPILNAAGPLDNFNGRFMATNLEQLMPVELNIDTTAGMDTTKNSVVYPGKSLLYSLAVPGAGQYYNKQGWLKIGMYSGIEIASLWSYFTLTNKANKIKDKYEKYADDHWSLSNWVFNVLEFQSHPDLVNYEDFRIDGTHGLLLHLSGDLLDNFSEFTNSDSLVSYPDWASNPNVSVVRDRDFYENIGKYDQFVGGWDDFGPDTWIITEKNVGDTVEILIKTPRKENYLNMRLDNNTMLKIANYAITGLLLNHIWSAIDAVYFANRKSNVNSPADLTTDVGLLYSNKSKYGIGGISFSVRF